MTDPRETLARIRAQADAATDGPWGANQYALEWEVFGNIDDYGNHALIASEAEHADAEFMAASRTNVPALLDLADAVLDLADELDRDGNAFMSDADPGRAKAAYAHAARIRAAATTALEGGTRA